MMLLWREPAGEAGEAIAQTLVEARLAACVNVSAPMTSVYRWDGRITSDVERQLVIKTTADRIPAIRERVAELHPYELPEFLVCAVTDGSARYLEWVRAESAPRDS